MNQTSANPAAILLVEDDRCAALLFRTMCQKEGYFVQHCTDGESALRALEQSPFDAVILDLMMPGIDGMQVLKRMRSFPTHLVTPVIVITAARLKIVEEEATRYGARLYLDKTQHEQLINGLREIMKERNTSFAPGKLRMASGAPTESLSGLRLAPSTSGPQPEGDSSDDAKGLGRFFRRKP